MDKEKSAPCAQDLRMPIAVPLDETLKRVGAFITKTPPRATSPLRIGASIAQEPNQ